MNIYELITYEDLSEDFQELSNEIGIVNVRIMIEKMAGRYFYIPNISYFKLMILRFIEENPELTNKQIAKLFGITVTTVQSWIRNK